MAASHIIPAHKFAVRRGLTLGQEVPRRRDLMPPLMPPPPRPPGLGGNYCFRATCKMLDVRGSSFARVVGYGPDIKTISDGVENACRLELDKQGKRGAKCSQAEATFLHRAAMECSGQIYYYSMGTTRQLV